mgnify:CR=1 FL=1
MVVVMTPEATDEDVAHVVERVESVGGEAFVSKGVVRTIIGLVGDIDSFHGLNLRSLKGVGDVYRISDPYKLVSRQQLMGDIVVCLAGRQLERDREAPGVRIVTATRVVVPPAGGRAHPRVRHRSLPQRARADQAKCLAGVVLRRDRGLPVARAALRTGDGVSVGAGLAPSPGRQDARWTS